MLWLGVFLMNFGEIIYLAFNNLAMSKMCFFQRFWYSSYEVIKDRSMYKDMPYAGVAFLLEFIVALIFLAILFYWKCFSIFFSIYVPSLDFSKAQMALIVGIPYVLLYLYNKRKGAQIIKKFETESKLSKKKRGKEFWFIVLVIFIFMIGGFVLRACLG